MKFLGYIQGDERKNHFNAIDPQALTNSEQIILANLNLYPYPTVNQFDFTSDIDRFIHFIAAILPEDLREALAVRIADSVNMFGATFHDKLSRAVKEHELRSSIQMHPYPWQAAGSSCVIVHQNKLNELSVALVYNQRRDKRLLTDPKRIAGIPDFYKLPEGYMHPKPCKGGESSILSEVASEKMDEAEELMLKGLSMHEAYKQIKLKHTNEKNNEPPLIAYDDSSEHCAMREAYEEVGL